MKNLLLALLLISATTAHGEFRVVETDADALKAWRPAAVAEATLTEIGYRPSRLSSVRAGSNVKMAEALKRLAPRDWKGYVRGVDVALRVSWDAADSWVDALSGVLKATGYAATIDWMQKRILLAQDNASARKPAPQAAALGGKRIDEQTVKKVRANAWVVNSGSLLRDTLKDWTAQAGWALVWALGDREDFRVEAGDTYQTDFKAAVRGLFDSLPAKVRIKAELRPDNVPPLLYVTRDEGGH